VRSEGVEEDGIVQSPIGLGSGGEEVGEEEEAGGHLGGIFYPQIDAD
jgi:hypothetical protein